METVVIYCNMAKCEQVPTKICIKPLLLQLYIRIHNYNYLTCSSVVYEVVGYRVIKVVNDLD